MYLRNFIAALALSTLSPFAMANSFLPLSLNQLKQFNQDLYLNNQIYPQGVPTTYDWYYHAVIQAGNTPPAGWTSMTGWGQIFWAKGVSSSNDYVEVSNTLQLICTINSSGNHVWQLVQSGAVAGAEYNADFSGGTTYPLPYFTQTTNLSTGVSTAVAGIDSGDYVFHYWYQQGRVVLPSGTICGHLTLQQARTVTKASGGTVGGASNQYVIGLGADYWINQTAPWAGLNVNNTGVLVGRLKPLTGTLQWFGATTASTNDLTLLYQYGYSTN